MNYSLVLILVLNEAKLSDDAEWQEKFFKSVIIDLFNRSI